jgi:sialic acid synthase SpsE
MKNNLFIIAEIGSNHNGSVDSAINHCNAAKSAGADCVKFQFIYPDNLYLPKIREGNSLINNPVYEIRKKEVLSDQDWFKIWNHCASINIIPTASVFCSKGIQLLKRLGAKSVKISSTDFSNWELINNVCEAFSHVIISSGMSSTKQLNNTIHYIHENNFTSKVDLLHCVSLYPCKLSDSNLSRIPYISKIFGKCVGYSDHTDCNSSALMALSLGSRIFEKHFTLDQSLPGFDHLHAQTPEMFHSYVKDLKDGYNSMTSSFVNNKDKITANRAHRGYYASVDIEPGTVLERKHIAYVRPSNKSGDIELKNILGKTVTSKIMKYSSIDVNYSINSTHDQNDNAYGFWQNEMKDKGMI